ncbi:hypothetical protein BT63DRAFT_449827 [Microthyrium microscopicum]|uniref:Uncharacterized protein n=1 Tax=Microthyrium microscopicum TaxID=703497 RepID=A0A6A6URC7_9PEZI|nr:hypothetical protein BT63DRAFT_449827 [Microthyrium microscopicum]
MAPPKHLPVPRSEEARVVQQKAMRSALTIEKLASMNNPSNRSYPLVEVEEDSCNAWHVGLNKPCSYPPHPKATRDGYLPVCLSHLRTFKLLAGHCRHVENNGTPCNKLFHWNPANDELCAEHQDWNGILTLMKCPSEIRMIILGHLLPDQTVTAKNSGGLRSDGEKCYFEILRVNRTLKEEGYDLLYNTAQIPYEIMINAHGYWFCGQAYGLPPYGHVDIKDRRRHHLRDYEELAPAMKYVRNVRLMIQFRNFGYFIERWHNGVHFDYLLEGLRAFSRAIVGQCSFKDVRITFFTQFEEHGYELMGTRGRQDWVLEHIILPKSVATIMFVHLHSETGSPFPYSIFVTPMSANEVEFRYHDRTTQLRKLGTEPFDLAGTAQEPQPETLQSSQAPFAPTPRQGWLLHSRHLFPLSSRETWVPTTSSEPSYEYSTTLVRLTPANSPTKKLWMKRSLGTSLAYTPAEMAYLRLVELIHNLKAINCLPFQLFRNFQDSDDFWNVARRCVRFPQDTEMLLSLKLKMIELAHRMQEKHSPTLGRKLSQCLAAVSSLEDLEDAQAADDCGYEHVCVDEDVMDIDG